MIEIVELAAAKVGGIVELGRRMGVNHNTFYQWTQVPPMRVLAIAKITGFKPSQIRPDLYPPPRRRK